MYLYNLTLQRATGITHAVVGNFSGTEQQEIAVSHGKTLELLHLDLNAKKVCSSHAVEIFGIIRSMKSVRLRGSFKDCLVVGSDSGQLVILEYNAQTNVFEKILQHTFGKSGCLRTVPGQHLAVDPKGRAVMIGAIEKQKLVYAFGQDATARPLLSPPVKASKLNTVLYDMVGIDGPSENPMFACLEVEYEDIDKDPTGKSAQAVQQSLILYELDLRVNVLIEKYNASLEEHGNFLISVPGGSEGPSGVLVCSENYIIYKNFGIQQGIRCPIPRRKNDLGDPERGVIFVCSATHKTESVLFFLAQTEQGDIFKITLETDKDTVIEVKLKYFDTVPIASAICILNNEFLFIASEFSNHYLYQVVLWCNDDENDENFSSSIPLEDDETFLFAPRPLKNLSMVDELNSLSPIMHCEIAKLGNEDTPELYVACGQGPRSSLRILRYGLEVAEIHALEFYSSPNAVWTLKAKTNDAYDAYIVVSFATETWVLSIGATVEVLADFGILGITSTLSCTQMSNDSFVQIYTKGFRYVKADKGVQEWQVPENKVITNCAADQQQMVIVLSERELVYFQINSSGDLSEFTEPQKMSADILCMSLASLPSEKQRSLFLAVGLKGNKMCMISLDHSDFLKPLSVESLPDAPHSVTFVKIHGEVVAGDKTSQSMLYLFIGLQNGVLLQKAVDQKNGTLSTTVTKKLGSKPIRLFKIKMWGNDAVVAMSDGAWLSYYYQNQFHLTPLSYEMIEYVSGFSTELCPEGILAISNCTLRMLSVKNILTLRKNGKFASAFNQVAVPLEYTPRQFVIHPESKHLFMIETDHGAYTECTKENRKAQITKEIIEATGMDVKMAQELMSESLPESVFGAPKGLWGTWASIICVIDPFGGKTVHKMSLEQNEAAFSICLVKFANKGDTEFLLVGTAKDCHLGSTHSSRGVIHTYKVLEEERLLELVHKTDVDDVPTAICPFQGRVLIGVGKILRIYDMGTKKLLRKCENKHFPNQIVTIHSVENAIIVGDVQRSFFYLRYKQHANKLAICSTDTTLQYITKATLLDCNTIAGADKFGNMSLIQFPSIVNEEDVIDTMEGRTSGDSGSADGPFQKAQVLSSFHVGEVVSSLQRAALTSGNSVALVYTTLSGALGVLVPFISLEECDFFQQLEIHMRSENPPLCGRDHLLFRSCYGSVKNVIDGDLCEQYISLEASKQKAIAGGLGKDLAEVCKQIEDIRTRYTRCVF